MSDLDDCHDTDLLLQRIRDQHQTLSISIGRGTSQTVVDAVKAKLAGASRHPDFTKFEELDFIYEKLEEETNRTAKIVVDDWIQVRAAEPLAGHNANQPDKKSENIHRAARTAGRNAKIEKLVKAFCAFRFKPWKKQWQPIDGLAVDRRDQREHSTVVIIALEPLDHNNGCFVELKYGEDVCVDGRAPIDFPGTGGGLGIFIDLNL